MNKDMKRKYDLIAKISGVVIGLVLVLGISYAVFRTTTMGDKDNVVNAGKLDVRVENEANEITIPNALPQTEEQGKSNTPYTFDIVNEGTIDAMYDLYIELSDDTTLKDNDIRYYLTKTVDGTETPIDEATSHYLSDALDTEKKEKKLYRIDINDELKTKDKVSYKLYLWIDYDATSEDATNKVFKGVIRVDASQLVERNETLLRKVDVSENSDGSAYAYVYDDGTLKIKGTGNLAKNISDMDLYNVTLNAYKEVLTMMGYDVSSIKAAEGFETWFESQTEEVQTNINNNFSNYFLAYIIKQTLEEMGYENTDSIVDYDTAISYLTNNGLTDENLNTLDTEESINFMNKLNETYNDFPEKSSSLSIKTIEVEEGITNIPEGLYTGNENIIAVTIPSTVTSIDDKAFYNCKNLISVEVGNELTTKSMSMEYMANDNKNNITYIGNSAFYGCIKLMSIDFFMNSKVTEINSSVFYNCTSITNVVISDDITTIGDSAFGGCTGITEIIIPSTVNSIDNNVFSNCTNLIKLTIDGTKKYTNLGAPNITDLTIIGNGDMADYYIKNGMYAGSSKVYYYQPWYSSKSSIKNINISNTITSIVRHAFDGCVSLAKVEIPTSVTSIGDSAFYNCTSLTKTNYIGTIDSWVSIDFSFSSSNPIQYSKNLYINNELVENITIDKNIKQDALSNLQSLKSVTLTDNVTSIGGSAFSGCTNITKIIIPNSVTSIGHGAFRNCTNLIQIKMPSSITSIGYYTFANCTSLTAIEISSSVTSIGTYAFENCTSLKETSYTGTIDEWVKIDFENFGANPIYYSKNLYINDELVENITIDTDIKQYTLSNLQSLKSVTLTENVTSIGKDAFEDCSSLTKTNYTGTVDEWINIGFNDYIDNPIYYSKNLYINDELVENITIDKDVKQYAFYNCKSLKSLTLTNNVESIGTYAFKECSEITKLTIDGTKNYGNLYLSNITDLIITGTGAMGKYSSSGMPWYSSRSKIKNVTISDTITSIGSSAFTGCTSLTKTSYTGTIDSWVSIDFSFSSSNPIQYSKNLYINNELVENITIDKDIKKCALYNLQSLKSVTLTNNVTSIGTSAFDGCTGITKITIPNSVTTIGGYAFSGWTSSQTINIDNTESYANSNFSSNWKKNCNATIKYLRT